MRDRRAEFQELIKREKEALRRVVTVTNSTAVKTTSQSVAVNQVHQEWEAAYSAVTDFLAGYDRDMGMGS